MLRRFGFLLLPVAAALWLLPGGRPAPDDSPADPPPLRPLEVERGAELEDRLAGGEARVYHLRLAAGDYLDLVVEQRGVDLALGFHGPGGERLLRIDSPNGEHGPERLVAVASDAGPHRLELRSQSPPGSAGGYRLRVDARRPATADDRRRAAAHARFADAEEARRGGRIDAALRGYRALVPLWRDLGERRSLAATHDRLGQLERDRGRLDLALAAYERSLRLYRQLGAGGEETATLNQLGRIHLERGDAATARRYFEDALSTARPERDEVGEASALNNLGLVEVFLGRPERALDLYSRAGELWRRLGLPGEEAVTLSNVGEAYSALHDTGQAREQLERALELMRREGLRKREAVTLSNLGLVHDRAGEGERAEELYRLALELLADVGYVAGEARTLNNLGCLRQDRGELEAAGALYRRALALTRRVGDRRSEAVALNNLGWLATVEGEPARALELHRRALGILRELDAPLPRAATLYGIARAHRRAERLDAAQDAIGTALGVVERVRGDVGSLGLRMSFFASRHELYEFQVELSMERYRRSGDPRHRRLAFETSERARARGFLDTFHDRLDDGAGDGDPGSGGPLGLEAIQRRLLDPDTLLLAYELAKPRSYLWLISPESIRSVELPGEDEIRRLAEDAHRLLARSDQRLSREAAARAAATLADPLLAPVAAELGGRRLLISAEGPLLRIPFAALPAPGAGDPRPLVVDHEVVMVPSASVLAELRRRGERRGSRRPASLAVVADPVYEPSDPRLAGRSADAGARSGGYSRLPGTAREAREILELFAGAPTFAAVGFDAERRLLLDGRLESYPLLHFAVHGATDLPQPELSALVLSRFDRAGRPVAGRVHAYEISQLRLPAELVVLSACESGLGKPLEGEGVLGLTRAFFRAGARRVVMSLWRVRDRSTSELMVRFYRQMLEHRLPPAAALRAAQISMYREPRWRSAYHWGGFAVQGDWR